MAEWRTPVFDRTMDNVKSVDRTSATYQKGALNADDLNRIEDNYKYLMAKLRSNAIFIPHRLRNYTETVLEYVQTGEVVPEYTLVEYIQSSGTQYINTGIMPSGTLKFVMDCQLTSATHGATLFGTRNGGNAMFLFSWNNNNSKWELAQGSTWYEFSNASAVLDRHTFEVSPTGAKIDSRSVSFSASTFTSSYPILLFARNSAGSIDYHASMKLYSCQVYDNDILVRDYVPVRDKNGVACLLDRVEKKYYYNAGTGEFSAPETGHKVVEYIESSGTQHIDTGFKPNQDTRVLVETEFRLSSVAARLFGAEGNSGTNRFIFAKYSGYYHARYNTSTANLTNTAISGKFTVDANKNVFTVNGTYSKTFTYGTFQSTNSMYLFAGNADGTATTPCSAKIYYCKIYDNGTLIRDYVPVLDANGVACLYDKLHHVYYRNKGTGTFTSGPEVPVETEPVYELIETQTTYTDWQENNLPWLSEINRIRANYNALVRLFLVGLGFSEQKESNYLDYIDVNNWEKIALAGKTMFENMEKEYRYCGVEISGGDRLL